MITKEESNLIKGIAIILMLIHHMFGSPSWWNADIMVGHWPSYLLTDGWFLKVLAAAGRLCIVLFAFVSGYGMLQKYKKHEKTNLMDSVKSLKKIVIPFELTLCIVIVFSLLTNCQIGVGTILKNICMIDSSIMPFTWYVRFYCLTVICMPVLLKIVFWLKNHKIPGIISMLLISAASLTVTKLIGYGVTNTILKILYEFFLYIPFILVGSIYAAYDWAVPLEKIRKQNSHLACFTSFLTLGGILLTRTCIFNGNLRIDPYLAILFITAIICIGRYEHLKIFKKIITALGKYSLGIWLIHSIFFFPGTWPQNTVYFLKFPPLQISWALLICFVYSFILNKLVDKL